MFNILYAGVIVFVVLIAALDHGRQLDRNAEQGRLLATLESIHSAGASNLVEQWRATYLSPSESDLTELRILSERVKIDPAVAAGAARQLAALVDREHAQEEATSLHAQIEAMSTWEKVASVVPLPFLIFAFAFIRRSRGW